MEAPTPPSQPEGRPLPKPDPKPGAQRNRDVLERATHFASRGSTRRAKSPHRRRRRRKLPTRGAAGLPAAPTHSFRAEGRGSPPYGRAGHGAAHSRGGAGSGGHLLPRARGTTRRRSAAPGPARSRGSRRGRARTQRRAGGAAHSPTRRGGPGGAPSAAGRTGPARLYVTAPPPTASRARSPRAGPSLHPSLPTPSADRRPPWPPRSSSRRGAASAPGRAAGDAEARPLHPRRGYKSGAMGSRRSPSRCRRADADPALPVPGGRRGGGAGAAPHGRATAARGRAGRGGAGLCRPRALKGPRPSCGAAARRAVPIKGGSAEPPIRLASAEEFLRSGCRAFVSLQSEVSVPGVLGRCCKQIYSNSG